MKRVDTLAKHLSQPHIAYGPYVQAARIALGEDIRQLKKIYLDTKYWVLFRDVRLKRNLNSDLVSLLKCLEQLVATGKVICPLSTEIFIEVFRQSDNNTLAVTVDLIDQLSGGVCLIEHNERMHTEAFHFLRQQTLGIAALHPLENMVWTRPAYVLGGVYPTLPKADAALQLAIQKGFFDQMWVCSLADMFNQLGDSEVAMRAGKLDLSSQLNEGKLANFSDYRTFKQLWFIELRGVLDSCRDAFVNIMHQMYEQDTGHNMPEDQSHNDVPGVAIANIIYEYFNQDKIQCELPTIRIAAGLHAGVRWDGGRRYKANDLADFRHACAALPYCDFFFTERSLRHLVQDRNLKYDTLYNCKVCSDPIAALDAIGHI